MKPFALLVSALFAASMLVTGCSGEADLGESCDVSGKTEGECTSGGVCGKPADNATVFQCLQICGKDEDCGAGRSCNGVDGSNLKGCRIKK
jgi:predicted small secreted protein